MDWEQVKESATEQLRTAMASVKINELIIDLANKEIKKCPTNIIPKDAKKNTK